MIDKKLFWDENDNLNFFGKRGRHYCNIDTYTKNQKLYIQKIYNNIENTIYNMDNTMPKYKGRKCEVTHLLLV